MSESLEVTCETVQQKLQSGEEFLLLDCREQDEYDTVHIDGATLLPMSELADRVGELDDRKQDDMVVYCHHGMRSLRVTRWLRDQGFTNVVSMSGGIDRWSEAIDPSKPRY